MIADAVIDRDRIVSALSHIPASDRELWVKMGMAVKSELSDDEGFSVWSDWSQNDDSYDERDAATTWRSISPDGGVGIGSLFHEAKARGWQDTGIIRTRTPAEIAQRAADRIERDEAARIKRASENAIGATKALKLWKTATPAPAEHPYLVRKQVEPVTTIKVISLDDAVAILGYSPKQNDTPLSGPCLVIPVKISDAISTCELIDGDGHKCAVTGGAKSGGYWAAQPLPDGDGTGLTLAICEGVATTLSVVQATEHHGIAALADGNMPKVAQAMRQRYPAAVIVIAADLDKKTGAPDRHAVDAAAAIGGLLAVPDFGPDRETDQTDFNDMAAAHGLGAVKTRIAAAVQSAGAWALVDDDAPEQTASGTKRKSAQTTRGLPYGFSISKVGVFYTPEGTDERPGKPMKVCEPLYVTALVRDRASENWGRVIEFRDADGVQHTWAIPMELLAGDGSEVRRELSRLGLKIGSSLAAKNRLSEYLIESTPRERARCVQQTGWFGNVFVMPDRTIGDSAEVVLYQSENKTACEYVQSGDLQEWRDNVGQLCIGNSRLIFAASASFAGMILRHAGQESGGIHFVGSSSTGKSTAQLVAASVYGSSSFKQSWRATGNALEGTCALHNDAALILDEMAEVEPKEIGSIVYMIGNGIGKGRASRTGDARQRKTWRLMIISSGEIGLAQHMRDGGKVAKAGQEVRMIDIAADAGAGQGLFEDLRGYDGGATLSNAIKEVTQRHYGAPAIAFLEHVAQEPDTFPASLKEAVSTFVSDNLPSDAGGQAERVCSKFAVIAVAGEYATGAGITGWQQGDAIAAAASCFKSWLDSRGGGGNQERTAILSSVKAFFESHGESRFSDVADTSGRITSNRAGFRKASDDSQEYFVLPEAYKRDVCAGFDMRTVSKVLTDAGWIAPEASGKSSQRKTLPDMGVTRCYVFTPKMWEA